ncbi:MAG: efflux transporter outer membrane subunit [Succinivibrionaceae bacterium]|nr:efflux transporter outer membrane subunit [Succinivibrionaceae bacterium]
MRANKTILALAASVAVAGCSLAPDYQRPDMPFAAKWDADTSVSGPLKWRDQFTDPELQRLIELGLVNNRDLKLATLNVAEYQARYRISRDSLLPVANGDAALTRASNLNGNQMYTTTYSVGAGLSWEIDFFGLIRNQKNAALENYFAVVENRKSAQISLIAAIANAYYTYVADKELLALSAETLKTEQYSYQLTKSKYDLGEASELELSQSKTAVASSEISVANYERVLKLDYNSLLILVGTELPDFDSLKKITNIEVAAIPVGAETTLLEQRPDIMAAEHQLKAANYSIGVAKAALFPRISLSAAFGWIAPEAGGLFESQNDYWSIGPALTFPIFNAAVYGEMDVADIAKEKAVVNYEKTIQTAFKEVSDALKSFDSLNKQYKSQQDLYAATKKYFEMADQRYNLGVDSYLTRLDAQRQYVSARQGLVNTKLQQLQTQINLYKAIGGGWDETYDAQLEGQGADETKDE